MKQTDAPERWILANRRSVIGLWNRFDQTRVWISGIVCLFLVGGAVPSVSFANVSMPLQEENGDATGSGDTKIADAEKGGEGAVGAVVAKRKGYLVRIPLPVTGGVADRVISSVSRVLEKEGGSNGGERSILVLEFDNRNGSNGIGSEFEECLKIARFLTSQEMNRLRTVAYLPGPGNNPRELFAEGEEQQSTFESHVVLIALSCEEIAMHQKAALGNAGVEMENVDLLYSTAYRVMSEKRQAFPTLVALSMLEKDRVVYRVELKPDAVKYVEEQEYQELLKQGKVVNTSTISGANSLGFFSSQDLQSYRLITHRVDSRRELADRYGLSPTALEGDPSLGEKWNAVRVVINGAVTERMVSWIENALNLRVESSETNLVIIEIGSAGGDPAACIRLASRLSQMDPLKVRTVAYVPERARGVSSVVALGCDHLVMKGDASLGGDGRPELKPESLSSIREALKEIAGRKGNSWSFGYGLLDPGFEVKRYKNVRTGRVRILADEEKEQLKKPEQWQELNVVDLSAGIDGETAENLGRVRSLVEDFEELKSFYQLAEDPVLLEPTLADKWVENFAHQLASPRIAWLVLFGAVFFMSMEFSNPGIGVPGFLSAVCWMLFFWSQYFDGNASVLEILLFVLGMICIVIEFFVLPGFGVFGIGGAIMVTVSIVLAVQTFVIPRSPEEMGQLTTSLLTFLGASSGFLVALFLFQKYADRIPVLRRLMLDSTEMENGLAQDARESLVDYDFLQGKSGITQTRLSPSGKAIIGNELYNVITDGRLIEKGTAIEVRKVIGNQIQVGVSEG